MLPPSAKADLLAHVNGLKKNIEEGILVYAGYHALLTLTTDAQSLREVRAQLFDDHHLSGGQRALLLDDYTRKIEDIEKGASA